MVIQGGCPSSGFFQCAAACCGLLKPVSAVSSSVTRALVEIREQLTRATAAMGRMLGNVMDFQVKSSREAAEMPAEVREDTRKA